eukprot:1155438-Pelagomonas_calceolata.AAC.6
MEKKIAHLSLCSLGTRIPRTITPWTLFTVKKKKRAKPISPYLPGKWGLRSFMHAAKWQVKNYVGREELSQLRKRIHNGSKELLSSSATNLKDIEGQRQT